MQQDHETMLEYVQRKLRSPAYNNAEVVRATNLGKATLSEIASGKSSDPRFNTVKKIYDYFQELDK